MAPETALHQEISPKLQKQLRRHAGKWVATTRDEVIAYGSSARAVYKAAKRKKVESPIIFRVPEKTATYFF